MYTYCRVPIIGTQLNVKIVLAYRNLNLKFDGNAKHLLCTYLCTIVYLLTFIKYLEYVI